MQTKDEEATKKILVYLRGSGADTTDELFEIKQEVENASHIKQITLFQVKT